MQNLAKQAQLYLNVICLGAAVTAALLLVVGCSSLAPVPDKSDPPLTATAPGVIPTRDAGSGPVVGQPVLTPTISATQPPALVLPGADGTTLVCEANSIQLLLAERFDAGAVPSRIRAMGDNLYILLDGALLRVSRLAADRGQLEAEVILERGVKVEGRVVQELVDLEADPERGLLYLLDKAGHIYMIGKNNERAMLAYRALLDEGLDLSPQLVAISLDSEGGLLAMDTALGVVWTVNEEGLLEPAFQSLGFTSGTDLTLTGAGLLVLRHDGTISLSEYELGAEGWLGRLAGSLMLSMSQSTHLGIETLTLVNALDQEVLTLVPDSRTVLTRMAFMTADAGLLRDAVYSDGRLYALLDEALIVFPGPENGSSGDCPQPDDQRQVQPRLYGVDVLLALRNWHAPIANWSLPVWPRVYPGASRLYRMGVHEGLDIYQWNAPLNFAEGYPIRAMAAGKVAYLTDDYRALDAEEFKRLVRQSENAGATSEQVLQRLSGIQVIVDHGLGIRSIYSHLNALADDLALGDRVNAGDVLGGAGVTGTQGEGEPGTAAPHLHVEIQIGDRYLGEGLTLRETMWWYEAIFSDQ